MKYLALFLLGASWVEAMDGITLKSVTLYQPNDVLTQRLGTSADQLAAYIKALEPLVTAAVKHQPKNCFAVTVAWDGKKTLISVVTQEEDVKLDVLSAVDGLRAIKTPQVSGPVAVALILGTDKSKPLDPNPPVPVEWQATAKDAAGNTIRIPDDLFK